MRDAVTAEIIAIGSELLLGGRVDTNSLYLTDALGVLGIEVRYKTVVGDDCADIARVVRTAVRRASLVVLTGGLGPTLDDCTREAVARVLHRPLGRSATALKQLTAWLRSRGRTPSASQLRQALIPQGAKVLKNPAGSAPGFLVPAGESRIVALPGVPIEARQMFEDVVFPWLRRAYSRRVPLIRRTLLTYGLGESEIERLVVDLVPTQSGISLGTLASPLGVTLSLTASSRPADKRARRSHEATREPPVRELIAQSLAAMRARLGSLVVGEGSATMEQVVGEALQSHALTLATAESCTGGLIGHRLTQVPGSSGYYYGGVVCYSNEAKTALLGVDPALLQAHGAVSVEVAASMAEGVRRRSGCAIGLSVTGIAGPGGATSTKPVGLVCAGLARADGPTTTQQFQFHGPRDLIKLRASQAALNWVRLALLDR